MMVMFGAPKTLKDHARRAALCAVEIQQEAVKWNRSRRVAGLTELQLGIGVNTGVVLGGNIGTLERCDYTVIGSAVNLAARLEKLAGPGKVVIGEETAHAAGEAVSMASIGTQPIKGLSEPVAVYEILGPAV